MEKIFVEAFDKIYDGLDGLAPCQSVYDGVYLLFIKNEQ